MKKTIFSQKISWILGILLTSTTVFGQDFNTVDISRDVMLRGGKVETQKDFNGNLTLPTDALFDGKYYAIAKLESALTPATQTALEQAGIELLDYVPYHSFVISVRQNADLTRVRSLIRSIFPIRAADRRGFTQRDMEFSDFARVGNSQYAIRVIPFSNISPATAFFALQKLGFIPNKNIEVSDNIIAVTGTIEQINGLENAPFVQFFELAAPPPVPEDERARSLHRTSLLYSDSPTGRKFDGAGEGISIPDDGVVGPHIDFHGRMVQTYPDLNALGGTHGDMTCGIAVGSGNLNPLMRGMASGANLKTYTINGYPHIAQAVANMGEGYYITSTSYSNGCNLYNADAVTGDNQSFLNPKLLHVFSAGNNASANCSYRGGFGSTATTTITGWGNITGGYKLGKNVIATANVMVTDLIDNTSSKGPSIDGRIKPDIAANGNSQNSTGPNNTYQVGGGTSAAAPGIGGISAQLAHAYRSMNNNQRPDGAFLKALMMNSADEVGNFGPDYTFGYGRVNADRAFKTMERRQYLYDSVTNGQTKTFPLVAPAGTKQVKVMLYWAEPAGSTTAGFALVNDLDLRLLQDTVAHLPWVLRREPVVDSLNRPATRGIDRLNNVEQVQIDANRNGSIGSNNFTIEVKGFSVSQGNQKFYLVYQFENDSIRVVFPNGGEGLNPSEAQFVRWDAYLSPNDSTFNTQFFTVDISYDGGNTWSFLSTASNAVRSFNITTPNNPTGRARVRVSRPNLVSDGSDANFSIIATPANLRFSSACIDSATFAWNPVANAVGYEVYRLGQKFMDSIATTTQTQITLPIRATDSTWMSVRTIFADGGKSRRANAIPKNVNQITCALPFDVGVTNIVSPAIREIYNCGINVNSIPLSVTINNRGINAATGVIASFTCNGVTVRDTVATTIQPSTNYTHQFSRPMTFSASGSYPLTITTRLTDDINRTNDTLRSSITVNLSREQTPITETFELPVFPPPGWSQLAAVATDTLWRVRGVTGANGQPTRAAMFNNYNFARVGAEVQLVSWLVDLRGQANLKLTFDVAYRVYGTSYDGLAIYVSRTCGTTWLPTAYRKVGTTLATSTATTTAAWFPTAASDWRRDELSLAPYRDSVLLIAFADICAFGQNLFIDNINVAQSVSTQNLGGVSAPMIGFSPNPVDAECRLDFKNFDSFKANSMQLEVFDAAGRSIERNKIEITNPTQFSHSMNATNWASGFHIIRIIAQNTDGETRAYQVKVVKK